LIALNFRDQPALLNIPVSSGWRKQLDSADERWQGPGSAAPESITPETSGDSPETEGETERAITIGASACVVFTRGL